jgi:glycosyltransferase involved in cell wall biosynthesis
VNFGASLSSPLKLSCIKWLEVSKVGGFSHHVLLVEGRSINNSITVFFPAYNDEGSIGALVLSALDILPRLTDDFEVLVINDGSTDGTLEVLEGLARTHARVRVISHEINLGYGAALRTGFSHAAKELIFYTDGDGQYDVRELLNLHALLTPMVDVVNGYKKGRADARHRKLLGGAYNRLAHLLFRLPVRDVDCDFRLLRREAVSPVELVSSSGVICVELVHKLHQAGRSFVEAPVCHYPRLHGHSQFFTPTRVARTAFDLLSLWLRLVGLPVLLTGWRYSHRATDTQNNY